MRRDPHHHQTRAERTPRRQLRRTVQRFERHQNDGHARRLRIRPNLQGGPRRRLSVQCPDGFDRRSLREPSANLPPRRPAHHGLPAGQDRHDGQHRLAGRHLPHGLLDQTFALYIGPHQEHQLFRRRQLPLPRRHDHRFGLRTLRAARQPRRQAQPPEIRSQLLTLLFEIELRGRRRPVRRRRRNRLGADGSPGFPGLQLRRLLQLGHERLPAHQYVGHPDQRGAQPRGAGARNRRHPRETQHPGQRLRLLRVHQGPRIQNHGRRRLLLLHPQLLPPLVAPPARLQIPRRTVDPAG